LRGSQVSAGVITLCELIRRIRRLKIKDN
jgi:hypothetical protein